MRTLSDLISDWEALGIVFRIDGEDGLHIDAPKRLLTTERLDVIKQYKPAIVTFLRAREEALDDGNVRGWIVILREAGAKIGIFNGIPKITWPTGWDTPSRRKSWQEHQERIARILRE